jgi:uncharacterized protein YbaR (Trm112 family)
LLERHLSVLASPVRRHHLLARRVEQPDPFGDEAPFARCCVSAAFTPPQAPWPSTTISSTFNCVTANSSAAETP